MIPQRVTLSWLRQIARSMYNGLRRVIQQSTAWVAIPIGLGLFGMFIMLLIHQLILWEIFGEIPAASDMRPMKINASTEVYTIDGKLIGKYYVQDRVPVSRDEVADCLVNALIATEDVRFYEHSGIDFRSLGRVFFKTLLLQEKSAGGGSTLTMQLAKNLYPRWELGWFTLPVNKLREMILAERLEAVFGKEEILMGYLNSVSFGENSFGIEVASQRYFHVSAANLQVEQAAVLVGMLKGTSSYNPRTYPDRARNRRNVVFHQMHKNGYLHASEIDSLLDKPLDLNFHYATHHDGLAPYFMAYLRQYLKTWFKEHPRRDGKGWNLYTDGLRIITPMHSKLQGYAQHALRQEMERIQKNFSRDWGSRNYERVFGQTLNRRLSHTPSYRRFKQKGYEDEEIDSLLRLPAKRMMFGWDGPEEMEISLIDSILYSETLLQAGVLAIDPGSGHIKAWVGGLDHRFYQYDHVTSRRQTGSVFKPLVYATALESGMPPCEYTPNEKVVFSDYNDWTPENSDNSYGGEYSMRGALTNSVNVVAVNLIMEVGAGKVVDLAGRLGLKGDIPSVPSIALGTAEASLFEMLGAYASFFNGGFSVSPVPILRIEDSNGSLIWDAASEQRLDPVIEPTTAKTMTYMMRNVVDHGTGRGVRSRYGLRNEIAGKTGTTQSQTDGWFIGATPDLLAGVWVGANDPSIHFRSMARGQGAATALPIWGQFMKRVLADEEFREMGKSHFVQLTEEEQAELDCEDLWFPVAMSEFKEWYQEQKRKDSLFQVQ